jgi:pyruvate ferredoxin oxidoreductase alpha subunit
VAVGTLGVTCFRPWPLDEIREALAGVSRVIVLNRAFSVGSGSILGADVRLSLAAEPTRVYDVVLGLGGRPVTRAVLRRLLDDVLDEQVSDRVLSFPDLDADVVARELDREGPDRPQAVSRGELGADEWGRAWT